MALKISLVHRAAIGAIAIYMLAAVQQWTELKYLLKPTVTLLIAYPTKSGSSSGIFWGLLFSTLGDICLMIPRDDMFVPGLLSFLVAHILYTASFRNAPPSLSWTAAPFGVYAAAMMAALYPGVAKEEVVVQVGVVVYMLVISGMAYRASLSGNALLIIGTLLFCLSDSILAWDKFLHSYEWCEFGIMITYYTAQLCIAIVHS
ncbi:hypothetical protein IWW37_001977 [Coemansia sp. RSA 2050]|nr:hypothetical protein IWW37_001977 [Coemansia sp. RSA 2050]KAJ2735459.1 hypothetical protein IW152_001531 [Coemansia sp. BCRC 34962]